MDPGFTLHSSCLFLNLGLEKPILALNLLCSLHRQSSGVTGARVHGLWVALISNQIGFLFTCLITLQFWTGEERLLVETQKISSHYYNLLVTLQFQITGDRKENITSHVQDTVKQKEVFQPSRTRLCKRGYH